MNSGNIIKKHFRFRTLLTNEHSVWVHNTKGPDCTLMSKVFKVKSSSHSNAVEEAEYKSLNENIDRGCFGVEVTSPTLGEKVPVNQQYAVQIRKSFFSIVFISRINSFDRA